MYSDRAAINRRNVTQDSHSNYTVNRDFLLIVLKSRVIAAAMKVLGLECQKSQPTIFQIPNDLSSHSKQEKLDILHKAAGMVVDAFVFNKDIISEEIDQVITTQEKTEITEIQNLNADGRFLCRFEGCKKSFKYDGKSKRKHELSHQSLPVVSELPSPTPMLPNSSDTNRVMHTDDIFNYNCALMTDGLLFLNFLDATSEGDGLRTMRQYKYMLLYFKADKQHSTKYALECLYQFFMLFALRFTWNRTINNAGVMERILPWIYMWSIVIFILNRPLGMLVQT